MRIITLLITLFAFGITPLQAFSYFSFKKYQVEDGLSHTQSGAPCKIAMALYGWERATV